MSNCKDNIQNIIINQKQQSSLSYLKECILTFVKRIIDLWSYSFSSKKKLTTKLVFIGILITTKKLLSFFKFHNQKSNLIVNAIFLMHFQKKNLEIESKKSNYSKSTKPNSIKENYLTIREEDFSLNQEKKFNFNEKNSFNELEFEDYFYDEISIDEDLDVITNRYNYFLMKNEISFPDVY